MHEIGEFVHLVVGLNNFCTSPKILTMKTCARIEGHNLNFAHSNEAGSYKDQSGMMGYSYSNDDGPKMCFNSAKVRLNCHLSRTR